MKDALRIALKIAIPLVIILAGVGVRMVLVATRPEPGRTGSEARAPLVEVQAVTAERHRIVVHAQGTVVPAQRVVIVPQVGGRILWQSPDLVPGGRVSEGTPLVRIDPRDYRVNVEQRGAELNRAQLEAELERGRQVVAQREWQLFEGTDANVSEEGRALALRQPQTENARVAVSAAQSSVRRAQIELRRTTITAPFDAIVQSEAVDVGQVVGPQFQLATLIGSQTAWVQVSVPLDNLARVDVPGVNATEGAASRVWQDVGEGRIVRDGRVIRMLGDLDPVGGMARVLVEIADPTGLEREHGEGESHLPLLVGAYVHVEIEGRSDEELIEIPRIALREGQQVWVLDGQDSLEIRRVDIAWRREDSVLVSGGLSTGDRLITSRLSPAVQGMTLRTEDAEPAEPAEQRAEAQ